MQREIAVSTLIIEMLAPEPASRKISYRISLKDFAEGEVNEPSIISVSKADRNRIVQTFYALLGGSDNSRGTEGILDNKGYREAVEDIGGWVHKTFLERDFLDKRLYGLQPEYLKIETNDTDIPWALAFDGGIENILGLQYPTFNAVLTKGGREFKQSYKKAEEESGERRIRILFIVNPCPNLQSEEDIEFDDIEQSTFEEVSGIKDTLVADGLISDDSLILKGHKTPDYKLKTILDETAFDILHYVGHSICDLQNPSNSSLFLTDKKSNPADIKEIFSEKSPSLIFLNSCSSGLIPSTTAKGSPSESSLFQAFFSAGVKSIIGTLWNVDTDEAKHFGLSFYRNLLQNFTVGQALQKSKQEGFTQYGKESLTWASYILYGEATFRFPKQRLVSSPFKHLNRYSEEDRENFIGREKEETEFNQLLNDSHIKVITLSGVSGVGKSSFLRARIIPALKENDWIVSINDLEKKDPRPVIIGDLIHRVFSEHKKQQPEQKTLSYSTLREFFLSNVKDFKRPVVIILDQFERFVLHEETERECDSLMADIAECISSPIGEKIRVKFVFTVREEYLPIINRYLKDTCESQFRQKFQSVGLDFLSKEEAEEIIKVLFGKKDMIIEKELSDQIIKDLRDGEKSPRGRGKIIYPPFLQIICQNLFSEVVHKQKTRKPTVLLTVNDYESIGETGELISNYIEKVITDLEVEKNGELGRAILKEVSSDKGTPDFAHDAVADLVKAINSQGINTSNIKKVLNRLCDERLLIRVYGRHQLIHDCIGKHVLSWMSKNDLEVKFSRAHLKTSRQKWKEKKNVSDLLDVGGIEQIVKHKDRLDLLEDDYFEFVFKSAIKQGYVDFVTFLVTEFASKESTVTIKEAKYIEWINELNEIENAEIIFTQALGKIKGSDPTEFLVERIIETTSDGELEAATKSLADNKRIPGITSLLGMDEIVSQTKKKIKIHAYLKEDYCDIENDEKRNLYEDIAEKAPIPFFEKLLRQREIFKIRNRRIFDQKDILIKYVLFGLIYGGIFSLAFAAWLPALMTSSITYEYYALKGEWYAKFKTVTEGVMMASLGGLFIFPCIKGWHICIEKKNLRFRIKSSLFWGAIIGLSFGIFPMGIMTANFSWADREPLYVAFGLGFALMFILVSCVTTMFLGLVMFLGEKPPKEWMKSICTVGISLSTGMIFVWLTISFFNEHNIIFHEGTRIKTLESGQAVRLLSFEGLHLWGDILRYYTWHFMMACAYIYKFYSERETTI